MEKKSQLKEKEPPGPPINLDDYPIEVLEEVLRILQAQRFLQAGGGGE
jgi:hypothetical protein